MLILGLDCSLPLLSVALLRDGSLAGAVALEGKGSRNEKVLPALDWLLRECQADRREIDLFAVTRGPGSFTGVRIGLATMQGLAMALGRPLCAMSTHEAIARGAIDLPSVTVIDDAGRGESYLTRFDGDALTVPPRLARGTEIEELAASSTIIEVAAALQKHNVAAAAARRAAQLDDQQRAAYTDITPIYVRLAEAEARLQQVP